MSINDELYLVVERTPWGYFRQIDFLDVDTPLISCPELYFELINWTMYCKFTRGEL